MSPKISTLRVRSSSVSMRLTKSPEAPDCCSGASFVIAGPRKNGPSLTTYRRQIPPAPVSRDETKRSSLEALDRNEESCLKGCCSGRASLGRRRGRAWGMNKQELIGHLADRSGLSRND